MKDNDVHEVSSRDKEEDFSTCKGVERSGSLRNETLSSPNRLQTGIKLHMDHSRLTSTTSSESRPGHSPHEELHQSYRTKRSKKYIKDEPVDLSVDERTPNARPTREPAESLNRKRHDAKDSRTGRPMERGSSYSART